VNAILAAVFVAGPLVLGVFVAWFMMQEVARNRLQARPGGLWGFLRNFVKVVLFGSLAPLAQLLQSFVPAAAPGAVLAEWMAGSMCSYMLGFGIGGCLGYWPAFRVLNVSADFSRLFAPIYREIGADNVALMLMCLNGRTPLQAVVDRIRGLFGRSPVSPTVRAAQWFQISEEEAGARYTRALRILSRYVNFPALMYLAEQQRHADDNAAARRRGQS
jgi:hypothetical protein